MREGATREELMEAIWVAAEMLQALLMHIRRWSWTKWKRLSRRLIVLIAAER
jgi:hypothetical protein